MAQVLYKANGMKLDVDATHSDPGKAAEYMLHGGQRVKVQEAKRAKPTLLRKGGSFFYEDGTTVNRVADVEGHGGLIDDETGQHVVATIDGVKVDLYETALAFARAVEGGGVDGGPSLAVPPSLVSEAPAPKAERPAKRHYVRRSKGRRRGGLRGGVMVTRVEDPRIIRSPVVDPAAPVEIKGSEVLGVEGGTRAARVAHTA